MTAQGFAVAAIDAPGHGDRPKTEQDGRFTAPIRERMAAGEPIGPQIARYNAALAARTAPEWQAAVFGLAGHETLTEAAERVTVPIEFPLQWDDELVPRDSGLALFDAFPSGEKTLHANPGRHMGVPPFELDSSERFFARHLLRGSDATGYGAGGR